MDIYSYEKIPYLEFSQFVATYSHLNEFRLIYQKNVEFELQMCDRFFVNFNV